MDPKTQLLRQVNPKFSNPNGISPQVFAEHPEYATSQVYQPTSKDGGKLSAYSGDKFTPVESFLHYTQNFPSAGVLVLNVEDFNTHGLVSECDNVPFEGHVSVDYTPFTPGQIKTKAKLLRDMAVRNGWAYQPIT